MQYQMEKNHCPFRLFVLFQSRVLVHFDITIIATVIVIIINTVTAVSGNCGIICCTYLHVGLRCL